MSTTITTRTPLPKWITSAYNKTNPTVDSITRELSATKVTDITQVKVGRFYLAKMPWYGRKYDEVIREMIAKAKKDQTIMDKINENKKKRMNITHNIIKFKMNMMKNIIDVYLKLTIIIISNYKNQY